MWGNFWLNIHSLHLDKTIKVLRQFTTAYLPRTIFQNSCDPDIYQSTPLKLSVESFISLLEGSEKSTPLYLNSTQFTHGDGWICKMMNIIFICVTLHFDSLKFSFQKLIDPCDEKPCSMNSECRALSYGYKGKFVCNCTAGWVGT